MGLVGSPFYLVVATTMRPDVVEVAAVVHAEP